VISEEVVIANARGLHARAAARFVQVASTFRSRVLIAKDGHTADGKSILGLLALLGGQGARLTISVDGSDENEALRALVDLVAAGFGEAG
jgi:phosphocarrier protein